MPALPSILSRWVNRLRTKPEMPAFDGPLLSTNPGIAGSAALTEAEVEAAVYEDYDAVVGKIVFLEEIECIDDDGFSATAFCSPLAIARIGAVPARDHVVRWMDDVACDPMYPVEILEPHPALSGLRAIRIYGTSRSTDGTVDPAKLRVASDAFQRWYADKPAVGDDSHSRLAANAEEPTVPRF